MRGVVFCCFSVSFPDEGAEERIVVGITIGELARDDER